MKIFNQIINYFSKVGTYRVVTNSHSYQHLAFTVQVRGILWWHNVKTFISDDAEYAKICAYELLEMLEDNIEPKQAEI